MSGRTGRGVSRMTAEQRGIAAAILAAFFGVAIGGPTLLRLDERRRHVTRQVAAGVDDVRARVRRTARRGRGHLRRLGGGTIWR